MTLTRFLLAGIAGFGLSMGSANAASMIQTFQVGNGGAPTQTTDLNNVAYVSASDGTTTQISLFNPAVVAAAGQVATLTGVVVTMNTSVQTGGMLKNLSANTQSFSFGLALTSFTSSGANTGGAAAQAAIGNSFGFGATGSMTSDFGTVRYSNVASNRSVNYPSPVSADAVTLTSTSSVTFTDASTLAAFTGTGGFGEDLNTMSGQTVSGGGGNVAVNLNTMAGGQFVVEYDYTLSSSTATTAVPEPASMALLGAGLLTAGSMRRRRH